jgi:uncharacterized delta-60 repeat protein
MRTVLGIIGLIGCFLQAQAASLVDTTFDIGSGANGIVEQVLQQPDGKVLICGNFTSFNGANKGYVARLHSNGSVDTSFTAGPGYWTRHMALQPDGKIVIGGYFTTVEGIKRNRIARLNADGSLDTSFDPGLACETSIGRAIDGNDDPFVIWCEVLASGRIVAIGNFATFNGQSSSGIVGINSNGSRDTSFNVGGGLDSWGRVIKPLGNGQIMVGGWFNNYNNRTANRLVRINEDGSADAGFNAFYGDKTAVYAVAVQQNGQMITSGHSLNEMGLFSRDIVRLNADGTVDNSWPGTTNEKTESLLMLPNGKVVVTGYFSMVNGQPRSRIARYNEDGSLDDTFIANADSYVWTVAPALDSGKILVSGGFTSIDGIPRNGVARLNLPEGGTGVVTPSQPRIVNARLSNGRFECVVGTLSGFSYILQYKAGSSATSWTSFGAIPGTGGPVTLSDPRPSGIRFYRVEVR